MRRRSFVSNAALATLATLTSRNALAADKAKAAKLATVAPDGTPWTEQLNSFKARVEKVAGDRLRVETFIGGVLGDENVTASETKRGAIQLWGGSTGALATIVPELALFELPYMFRNPEEADLVMDVVLYDDVKKLLSSRGLVMMFWAENGYRSFGTSAKVGPVKTPKDFVGKKMRSQESDVHIEMYRALGASPVPISVTEVLTALQTGVVDGFDNTPLFTFAASWHQGIRAGHYTLAEAIYQPGVVVANKDWFDKLPPDIQKALTDDQLGEAKRGREAVRMIAPELVANFEANKITVHTLTEAEKDVMAKACEPAHEKWLAGKGKSAAPMVKKAKDAIAAHRAKKKTK